MSGTGQGVRPRSSAELAQILIAAAPPLTTAQVDTIRAALNRGSGSTAAGIRQRPVSTQKAA